MVDGFAFYLPSLSKSDAHLHIEGEWRKSGCRPFDGVRILHGLEVSSWNILYTSYALGEAIGANLREFDRQPINSNYNAKPVSLSGQNTSSRGPLNPTLVLFLNCTYRTNNRPSFLYLFSCISQTTLNDMNQFHLSIYHRSGIWI